MRILISGAGIAGPTLAYWMHRHGLKPTLVERSPQLCVKMGGKYVLYDSASKKVYQLDDQTKPEQFAGQNVKA